VPQLREFNAQELANTAWARHKASHAYPALLDAIAAAALPRLRDFNVSNLVHSP